MRFNDANTSQWEVILEQGPFWAILSIETPKGVILPRTPLHFYNIFKNAKNIHPFTSKKKVPKNTNGSFLEDEISAFPLIKKVKSKIAFSLKIQALYPITIYREKFSNNEKSISEKATLIYNQQAMQDVVICSQ